MKELEYGKLLEYDYKKSFDTLNKYSGISFKVADCICLLGLHFHDVVPIDIHIFRTAKKLFSVKEDRLNKRVYLNIKRQFNDMFGEYSGLAQLYFYDESVTTKRKTDLLKMKNGVVKTQIKRL